MTRYTPNWLQQGSYSAAMDRRLIGALWPAPATSGCAVTVSSGMTVNVAAGQVAVPSQNSTGTSLCSSDAVEPVTLAAAPASGQNRYDLVICQPRGNDLDGGANNDFIFTTVTGTALASPTVPATPAGSVALAQIYVPGGSASVTAGNITDVRPSGLPISASSPQGTLPNGYAQITAGSASFGATAIAIAGLAVTVAVTAGRRLKITADGNIAGPTTGSTQARPMLYEDGVQVAQKLLGMAPTPANFSGFTVSAIRRPAAGNHTYQLYCSIDAGSATIYAPSAANPAYILAEDIGGN
jgi:hypothetical protein